MMDLVILLLNLQVLKRCAIKDQRTGMTCAQSALCMNFRGRELF